MQGDDGRGFVRGELGLREETWYFKKLVDIRKELNIHPVIDIRLLEKTEGIKKLIAFAETQKDNSEISFDRDRDKMVIVFDADIFEKKVQDFDEVIAAGEQNDILAVTNPAFELFLLLHFENSYEEDIHDCEGKITCNIGQIIENIRNDDGKPIR